MFFSSNITVYWAVGLGLITETKVKKNVCRCVIAARDKAL